MLFFVDDCTSNIQHCFFLMIWDGLSLLVLGRMISYLKILPISKIKYVILEMISINRLLYTSHSISYSICFLASKCDFFFFFFFFFLKKKKTLQIIYECLDT